MKKEWIFLIIYYVLLLIYPLGRSQYLRILYITALVVGISIAFLFLYRVIGDERLFYVYNFIALLGIVFSLANYDPYSLLTLALAYLALSLLFLHMTYYRFTLLFGNVKGNTIAYTLLTIPMAYLSVLLFLIYPMGYGFWGVFILVMLIVILLYFLMRSSESQKSSHTT